MFESRHSQSRGPRWRASGSRTGGKVAGFMLFTLLVILAASFAYQYRQAQKERGMQRLVLESKLIVAQDEAVQQSEGIDSSSSVDPNLVVLRVPEVQKAGGNWRVQLCVEKPLHSTLQVEHFVRGIRVHRGGDSYTAQPSLLDEDTLEMEAKCGSFGFYLDFPVGAFGGGIESRASLSLRDLNTEEKVLVWSEGVNIP